MKTLIIILILASFLQTTIIPVNLVLLILICRSYIKSDKANLYLAFGFGLLVSHLGLTNLGLTSLIYVIIIEATMVLSKWRLADNPLLVVPISFIFLYLSILVTSGVNAVSWPATFLASFLALPLFYVVRIWEERFIVRKEIKLRI